MLSKCKLAFRGKPFSSFDGPVQGEYRTAKTEIGDRSTHPLTVQVDVAGEVVFGVRKGRSKSELDGEVGAWDRFDVADCCLRGVQACSITLVLA